MKRALIQGAGLTDDGTLGVLLEAEVEPISNDECSQWIATNSEHTTSRNFELTVKLHLPNGLNKGIICALPLDTGRTDDRYKDPIYTVKLISALL